MNFEKNITQSEKARREQIRRQFTVVPLTDPTLLEDLQQHGVTYQGKIESHFFSHLIGNWLLPFGILFLVWGWIMRKMGRGGPGFLNVGKNRAKIYEVDPSLKVTFEDVAGADEAVEEVKMDAKQMLTDKGDKLEKMAQILLEKEKMDENDILAILGPRSSKKENEFNTRRS